MSLPLNTIKEHLSIAYVKAVSAKAGIIFETTTVDFGMDGSFSEVEMIKNARNKTSYATTGFHIDVQLKSSENIIYDFKSKTIKYDLDSDNYNMLVDSDVGTPRILVLYSLPKDQNDWVLINDDEMRFRKCAWWCSLKGKRITNNVSKIRIEMPMEQMLTCESLIELMSKAKAGDIL